jgi:sugar phosphate isomerase/epimerase
MISCAMALKQLDFWLPILEILNRAHYRGFISVGYEDKEDELLAVPRGVKFLKKHI